MLKKNKNYKFKTREKSQSARQLKVSQLIHQSLIECLQKSGKVDPLLKEHMLNFTKVNVTPDLRLANCFYLPLNQSSPQDLIAKALENSKYAIREYITKKINLRYSPEIRFFFDSAYEEFVVLDSMKN